MTGHFSADPSPDAAARAHRAAVAWGAATPVMSARAARRTNDTARGLHHVRAHLAALGDATEPGGIAALVEELVRLGREGELHHKARPPRGLAQTLGQLYDSQTLSSTNFHSNCCMGQLLGKFWATRADFRWRLGGRGPGAAAAAGRGAGAADAGVRPPRAGRAAARAPGKLRARLHCRRLALCFCLKWQCDRTRNRGTTYVSDSGMKRMSLVAQSGDATEPHAA